MTRTADLLQECIYNDIIPSEISILVDYFGIHNINDEKYIKSVYGVYSYLIKFTNINADILHESLINNSLDNLIHSTYKNYHCNEKNYQDFCKYKVRLQINIDEQYFNFEIPDEEEIKKNNDICPNCNLENYSKNFSQTQTPDCKNCYEFICKICSITDKDEPWSRICINCYNANKSKKSLESNIRNKISSHKHYDKNRFKKEGDIDLEFIKTLLEEQNYLCFNCNDVLETIKYKAYCCYQFSIDRIDNNLPHNKNNVRIRRYYCNCNHHPKFDQPNKVCTSKCHKIAKSLSN